ncbi:GTPase-activating protein RNA1 [Aspergillus saccharolyticus JOP 1030-1]|uniref:Ran GTPase activating protein 1 n=1 Tax=Aspergillus saccharolyticus JOP 1030-1 TaxID=1450539 RepID=A0A318ZMZ6_9EURO|nr:ran GTPase activating protein 1 [Aspergillus saccharolyticus JOP 1030-1]PYH47864.1 ran GTPase activating protein 1 [Aspergillus saccharolyticus JOP 1030-1]
MAPPKVFSLEGKGLKLDSAEDIETHIKPLLESTDYTEIRFGGNTLGVPACERLASVLSTQKNLEVAELADIFTSRLLSEIPDALTFLLNALLEISTLHTVNLSDNAFGANTQKPLVDFLARHVPLRHLILNNNGMGPEAGSNIAKALIELAERKEEARKAGKEAPLLESIVCGRNRLENGSMAAWARAYEVHAAGMRSVKMTQNGIRQEGISLLLKEGLRHCKALEVVDLQDNTFTIMGSTALAGVLGSWSSLRELGVSDCLLSGRGGVKVAQALAEGKNEKVQTLRLQYNEITAEGVKQLLHATKSGLPALRRIELNGNIFMEEDDNITELREILEARKEEHGSDEDPEEMWGVDELDELEEEESEEEEEAEEEEEEEKAEKLLKDADLAENEKVAQKEDKEVDQLANLLGKTGL